MTETLIPMAGAGKRFSQFISSAVDINPKKQGTFIAGTGHPIISYEQLKDWGITCVIVVNPNFFDEIKILMEKNNLNIKLINLTKSQL